MSKVKSLFLKLLKKLEISANFDQKQSKLGQRSYINQSNSVIVYRDNENEKDVIMSEPKLVIKRNNNINNLLGEVGVPKKPTQKAVNFFKTQNLLVGNVPVSSVRDAITNTISNQSQEFEVNRKIDKSKYNDVLRDYNTQAAQNNCKAQCHGYEAGFEEEKEFNTKMQEMHKRGYANKGHALTYRETNWWWKFGNGDDLWVDGNMIRPLDISSRTVANPFPRLDDLKVHGSVTPGVKNKDRIYDGLYDFDIQEDLKWNDFPGHARNILNEKAIEEHGIGQPFMIRYDYGDRGKVK